MKNVMIAGVVASLTATASFAGGIAEPVMTTAPAAPVAVAAPVVMTNDWSGFYAGAQVGFGQLEAEFDDGTEVEDEDLTSYGVQAGYLYDLGKFVVGAEAAYAQLDIDGLDDNADVLRAGVVAGYDAGRFLPYVTAGYANVDTNAIGEDDGYYYGAGVDYAVTSNVRVGVEYLEHKFDNFEDAGIDLTAKTTSLKVSYAF
ncbi:outer membrane protein [Loktanella sp. R86503]|uniref:outer membrane protein n=1 Tax=Loktanella sp. R86503 TaxID=3093847 RepID=UPI0036DA4029